MSLVKANGAGEVSTGFYNGVIGQSLRFDSASSSYLQDTASGTPSSTTNRAVSFWVKRSKLSTTQQLLTGYVSGPNVSDFINFRSDDTIMIYVDLTAGGSDETQWQTTAKFRDTASWYHIFVKYTLSESSNADKVKLYVNGNLTSLTATQTGNAVTSSRLLTNGTIFRISNYFNNSYYLDGYLAEYNVIDGDANHTDFGETKNGVWIPKSYSGSYGNSGFRLTFEAAGTSTTDDGTDNSSNMTNIGDDKSGNGNNFAVYNLVGDDIFPDTPENNFPTLNLLDKSGGTFTEGNLRYDTSSWDMATGTVLLPSGKWYYEVRVDAYNASANAFSVGIIQTNKIRGSGNSYYWSHSSWSTSSQGYLYGVNVNGTTEYKISAGSATSLSSHPDIVQGSVIGIFIDLESDTTSIKYNIDGGTPFELFTSMQDVDYTIGVSDYLAQLTFNFGQDSTFAGQETAGGNTDGNGKGDFHTALPSGHTDYLAICSANLPDTTLSPAEDEQATDYFNTVLYTANNTTNAVTGVGFQPDFVWIKRRNVAAAHAWWDSSRGTQKWLYSDDYGAEIATSDGLSSFDSDGFTLGADSTYGSWNNNGTHVSWNWKINGGTTSSDTNGNRTSTVQTNAKAGISIATYTNTSGNHTFGHGLGSKPEAFIWRARNQVMNWIWWDTYNFTDADADGLYFNSTIGFTAGYNWVNDVSSTIIDIQDGAVSSGSNINYVCYSFKSVEGFSKINTYTGNNSADGTFVYTGFRPAWIMIKRIGTAENWWLLDNTRNTINPVINYLSANTNNIEYSNLSEVVDFTSNGIKIRTTTTAINANGSTYVYMAFAEQPFKFSNAR
jgi:hypothetical protein